MIRLSMMALLLVSAIAAAEPTTQPSTRPATQPAAIAEVRTVTELMRQPLIDAPGGARVRLGMSPLDLEVGPWRTVYCQVEVDEPPLREPMRYRDARPLGPLDVRIGWDSDCTGLTKASPADVYAIDLKGPRIYAAILPATDSGNPHLAHLMVLARDGTLIAEHTQQFETERNSPWRFLTTQIEKAGEESVLVLCDEPGVAVVPRVTVLPLQLEGEVLDVAERLKIAINDRVLVIDAGKAGLSADPECILSRWWINGKPWTATQPVTKADMLAKQAGEADKPLRVAFHLPAALKRSLVLGDRVSLQVLNSPQSAQKLTHEGFDLGRMAMVANAIDLPELSNRLEIVVTDAMLK